MENKLTRFEAYSEFQAEYPLSHELPYWEFLDSGDAHSTVLSDGTLVQALKLKGISVETMDADRINQLTLGLRSFLNSLADGLELQFFVDVNSDFSAVIDGHEKLKGDHPLVSWISQSRIEALRGSQKNQELQKINLYLFIYQRVTSTTSSLKSFFEKPKAFLSVRRSEHVKRVHELNQATQSIKCSLESLGVKATEVDSNEAKSLIYRILNPKRSQTEQTPHLSKEHRTQEFTQEELKRESKLSLPSPREQLAFFRCHSRSR